jgi:diguanylate cyclase (GGDEF)-like protein
VVRAAQVAVVGLVAVFAAGVLVRPAGDGQMPWLDIGVYDGVFVLAAGIAAARGALPTPTRVAWRVLAVSLALGAIGNAWFSLVDVHTDPSPAFAVSDAFYLVGYLGGYVAVLLLLRARVPRLLASMWLDGLVTGLGIAAAFAGILIPRVTDAVPAGKAVSSAGYVVGDVLLVTVLGAGVTVLGARLDRLQLTVCAGLVLIALSNLVALLQDMEGTFAEGGVSDLLALLGVAAFVLAPDRDVTRSGRPSDGTRLGWGVLALPGVASVSSLAMLGLPHAEPLPPVPRALAAACLLVALARVLLTFRDIRALHDVHRQARTDDLTGLPNRRAFYEQCEAAVAGAGPGRPVALALLDLDRFKEINDSLGHAAGDSLLVEIGRRLQGAVGGRDVLARLGGDEFAVLLPGVDEAGALHLAHGLRAALGGAFELHLEPGRDEHREPVAVHVDASVGLAASPGTAATRTELMRCADVAMYRAKTSRTGVVRYSEVDTSRSLERLRIVQDLRRLLDGDRDGGDLQVHLQPQAVPGTGLVAGVEALVRWRHPQRGLLTPADFLTAAESAGLMGALDERVLDLALATCLHWWDGARPVPVSVNVSAANVQDPGLPAAIEAALGRYGLPGTALVVELTEDSLMTDRAGARGVLDEIRRMGAAISIDDYGTGYSSLAYLRDLSVDELKIDRTFTARLAEDTAAVAIVRHTVALGHALGLRLVAEGVEDPAVLAILGGLGCDLVQGFHIASPMPPGDLLRWLGEHPLPAVGNEPMMVDTFSAERFAPHTPAP